jgi:hypothetical protein
VDEPRIQDDLESQDRLARLFAAYKASIQDPEPSVNFMPTLWQKIEGSQRSFVFAFPRVARHFLSGAVALCLLLAAFAVRNTPPKAQSAALATASYVEALADRPLVDNPDYVEVSDNDSGDIDLI